MKQNQEILKSMLHTVQMGQHGIMTVLQTAESSALKQELKSQHQQYDSFEHQTKQLAEKHGLQLTDIHPAVLTMSAMVSKARLMGKNVDSKIAGMMIQGNTRGMIQGLKKLHQYPDAAQDVQYLANQLLNKENINIQNIQPFL